MWDDYDYDYDVLFDNIRIILDFLNYWNSIAIKPMLYIIYIVNRGFKIVILIGQID